MTLKARGGQQRVAEQMAEAPGPGHLLWDFLANEARSYLLPIEYLGKLRTPGLEKITDRSPMKPSVIKEGEQSEWGAREAVTSAGVEVCGKRYASRVPSEVV